MANACTIFSLVNGNLSGIETGFDTEIEVVANGVLLTTEIFSCRPDDIKAYLSSLEGHYHHTFIGSSNFTEGCSYHHGGKEVTQISGFINDEIDTTIQQFTELTEDCPTEIVKAIFIPYLTTEIEVYDDILDDDAFDEWALSMKAQCEELLSLLRD